MKKHLYITKKVKLNFDNESISINDINIDDIIKKYENDYIIDLENYIMTVTNIELIVTFKLTKK